MSTCAAPSAIEIQDVRIRTYALRRDALNYRGRIRLTRLVLGGIFLGALHATAASASPVVVDFDSIDAAGVRVHGAPIVSYLASYGISFSTSYPLIEPAVYPYPYYITTVSAPNYFSPDGMATFYTYNLGFSTPLDSFGFTRPGLGSATMAQWTATAYSAADTVLGSVGENMLFSGAPAATTFNFHLMHIVGLV
jgi:hypothetical protein